MIKNSVRHSVDMRSYNPNRRENITIGVRDKKAPGHRHELKFSLPARLSLPFHWWLMKQGMISI